MDTLNAAGQKTQETTPAPAGQSGYETTTYTYDGNGNQLTTTAPPTTTGGPSQVTSDTYNAAGELATETTGYGTSAASTVSYCYDPDGDKTSVVYADGNTSGTAQCPASSPWKVTASPQAGYQSTYSYDSARELVSATTPATAAASGGATTTSTYDPAGNKLTSTDPNGVTTTWTYTPLDQTATESYSGSSAHAVSYVYDADGNRASMSDATGSSTYGYDPFGEVTSAQSGAGQTITYGYDSDGNQTGITYPLLGSYLGTPHRWPSEWVAGPDARRGSMDRLPIDPQFANRSLNEGFSGGEKKRYEILHASLWAAVGSAAVQIALLLVSRYWAGGCGCPATGPPGCNYRVAAQASSLSLWANPTRSPVTGGVGPDEAGPAKALGVSRIGNQVTLGARVGQRHPQRPARLRTSAEPVVHERKPSGPRV